MLRGLTVDLIIEQEPPATNLNQGQQAAISRILEFISSNNQFFLLFGDPGTGKTTCIQGLIEAIKGKIIFTAPTNKATKVLRSTLTSDDYTPECRTIYSLLGLKMEANGAVKVLKSPEDPVDLGKIALIVVDEASMINAALMTEINKAVDNYKLKFLFLGDANQLPPVNEKASLVWELAETKSELTQVMRFEGEILTLANRIKQQVNHPAPSISLENDNKDGQGVWHLKGAEFISHIKQSAKLGDFSSPIRQVKAIAWRNATVSMLNKVIRAQIFDNSQQQQWLVGDRIILTGPAADMDKKPIGCTDDEGTVEKVTIASHPIYSELTCYNLSVITDENKRISLWVLHEKSEFDYRLQIAQLAQSAKQTPRYWKDFWAFSEAFHSVQHGYAITAHRAQGSTYDTCYVVWNDILANRSRNEAFRCLYVACTRPKTKLILGSF